MEKDRVDRSHASQSRPILAAALGAAPGLLLVGLSVGADFLFGGSTVVRVDQGIGVTQGMGILAGLLIAAAGASLAVFPATRRTLATRGTLLVGSAMLAAVGAEIAYRVYLAGTNAATPGRAIKAISEPLFKFDKSLGYSYRPGVTARTVLLEDNVVVRSWDSVVNERGTVGDPKITDRWDAAAHRVLVVGDSFSANHEFGGIAWADYFFQELTQRGGLDVAVMNSAQPAFGILQMVSMASARIAEYKPTVIVMAFIEDDLNRGRVWRATFDDGKYIRSITTPSPSPEPGPLNRADNYLVRADVHGLRDGDRAGALLEQSAFVASEAASAYREALWSLQRSFVITRILYSDPLANLGGRNPRFILRDFRNEHRFVNDVKAINASGVPVVIVHLPTHPQLAARSWIPTGWKADLVASLQESLEHDTYIWLGDHIRVPEKELAESFLFPIDHHPSAKGARMYGTAIANALLETGVLPGRVSSAASPSR